jgi:hypothetical protein
VLKDSGAFTTTLDPKVCKEAKLPIDRREQNSVITGDNNVAITKGTATAYIVAQIADHFAEFRVNSNVLSCPYNAILGADVFWALSGSNLSKLLNGTKSHNSGQLASTSTQPVGDPNRSKRSDRFDSKPSQPQSLEGLLPLLPWQSSRKKREQKQFEEKKRIEGKLADDELKVWRENKRKSPKSAQAALENRPNRAHLPYQTGPATPGRDFHPSEMITGSGSVRSLSNRSGSRTSSPVKK